MQHDPDKVAQAVLDNAQDFDSALEVLTNAVNEFLRVETVFDGKLKDEVVRELTKANKENLVAVIQLNQAHQQLQMREKFLGALLRQVETLPARYGNLHLPVEFVDTLEKLSSLKDKSYGELKLIASDIILQSRVRILTIALEQRRETRTVVVIDSHNLNLVLYVFVIRFHRLKSGRQSSVRHSLMALS